MAGLVKDLLTAWRDNGERWETVRSPAEKAGLKVFNPGLYAADLYEWFLERYPPEPGAILVLGLNPGPAGMAQTGVPFTDVRTMRDHLGHAKLEMPGRAPGDLVPLLKKPNGKWKLTYERSSLVIYRFLNRAFGDLGEAYRHWYVGNPCPLLFLERDGGNVTPADRRLRKLEGMQEMRVQAMQDFARVVRPRAVLALGRDVQGVVGEAARAIVDHDPDRYVEWPHPARASPDGWAEDLKAELKGRGLL